MTHLYFTLETKEIQNLIDKFVENNLSEVILTTVFDQLIKEQRKQFVQTNVQVNETVTMNRMDNA